MNHQLEIKKRGFTLLEILLSIFLISIIAGISVPVYQFIQNKNNLDVATNTVAQSLRRAQILAQASDGDISWGLKVQSNKITIFKGINYAGRDTTMDEDFDLPTTIIPSGLSEVVFLKFTGLPQTTGTITLTFNNEIKNITINSKGNVNY